MNKWKRVQTSNESWDFRVHDQMIVISSKINTHENCFLIFFCFEILLTQNKLKTIFKWEEKELRC